MVGTQGGAVGPSCGHCNNSTCAHRFTLCPCVLGQLCKQLAGHSTHAHVILSLATRFPSLRAVPSEHSVSVQMIT